MQFLLGSITPDVQDLFADAFSDTIYTKTIKRAKWDPKETHCCFMREESSIDELKVNIGIVASVTHKAREAIAQVKRDTREVNVRMLRADWIF